MLNRSASLAMSICVLKALPGKRDIKRHSPSILYIPVSQKFHKMYNDDYVEGEYKFLMVCSVCSTLRVKFSL